MTEREELKPCGGCGANSSKDRCIGCLHDFGDKDSEWVRQRMRRMEQEG